MWYDHRHHFCRPRKKIRKLLSIDQGQIDIHMLKFFSSIPTLGWTLPLHRQFLLTLLLWIFKDNNWNSRSLLLFVVSLGTADKALWHSTHPHSPYQCPKTLDLYSKKTNLWTLNLSQLREGHPQNNQLGRGGRDQGVTKWHELGWVR